LGRKTRKSSDRIAIIVLLRKGSRSPDPTVPRSQRSQKLKTISLSLKIFRLNWKYEIKQEIIHRYLSSAPSLIQSTQVWSTGESRKGKSGI